MFGLVVRFELKDEGAAAGFDALVELTAPKIRSEEPGTAHYIVHTVPDHPLSRVFYEIYDSREAFEDHENQPHVQHFLEQRKKFLETHEVTFLSPTGGKGLITSE